MNVHLDNDFSNSGALQDLQRQFKCYLLNEHTKVLSSISEPPTGDEAIRMQIYFDAYRLRLVEILTVHYEALTHLIGNESFEQLGLEYLAAYPSKVPNIRYFGDRFTLFLQQSTIGQQQPQFIEMAEFEWILAKAIDAADMPIANTNAIAEIKPDDWPAIRLQLHPSVSVCWFYWNVTSVWQAIKDKTELPAWQKENQPLPCIIWRKDQISYYQAVQPWLGEIIVGFQETKSFAQICEQLTALIDEDSVPTHMVEALQFLFARDTVSEIYLD